MDVYVEYSVMVMVMVKVLVLVLVMVLLHLPGDPSVLEGTGSSVFTLIYAGGDLCMCGVLYHGYCYCHGHDNGLSHYIEHIS